MEELNNRVLACDKPWVSAHLTATHLEKDPSLIKSAINGACPGEMMLLFTQTWGIKHPQGSPGSQTLAHHYNRFQQQRGKRTPQEIIFYI